MRKILAFIIFLLFLLLLWYSYYQYQDCCKSSNTDNVIEETKTKPIVNKKVVPEIKNDGSLLFNWKSEIAHENEFWSAKKTEVLQGKTDGKILKILGPYFKGEGKEIGVLRAKSVYGKLSDRIDVKQVEFGSKLVTYYDGVKDNSFSGTAYSWLIRNENITEINNKALIYFPSNSTKKISNVNIVNYLKSVANSIKNNDKKIFLTGHSDNRGDASKNKILALSRAKSIKTELVRLGVDTNRISTMSFGEEKPIASNDTKAGQQKNRRVELEIK